MIKELIIAARTVLAQAERAGSRVQFGSGDEPDIWIEYKEVPLTALEELEKAISIVEDEMKETLGVRTQREKDPIEAGTR